MHLSPARATLLRRLVVALLAFVLAMVLVVIFFPWDWLRGPINKYVSNQLGRRFEITRHLDVKLGRTTTVIADGIEFANPDWARDPYLVKAEGAEFDIRLFPLIGGKVVLPRISLKQPQLGLQVEADGRRTWALSRDTSDQGASPEIGALVVDQGKLAYLAAAQGADVAVDFSLAQEAATGLPLRYKATGKWKGEPFRAEGRTGGVLQLSQNMAGTFPIEVDAAAGPTTLKAKGSIANLAEFAGIDATFDLRGRDLGDLYKLLGVVLPSTPPYRLRGKLDKQGKVWAASQIQGTLGSSDLNGALSFDTSNEIPLLTGKVQSRLLDFADLAPVIGLAPVAGGSAKLEAEGKIAKTTGGTTAAAAPSSTRTKAGKDASRKVLPTTPLDVSRLKAMNADVTYSAADIKHVEVLPLDKGSVHVKLQSGVLALEPISLGVAGGTVGGRIRIDANQSPAQFATQLDVRGVQINKLFPAVETTRSSLGRLSGDFDLQGRGNSAAQMLASANGNVAVLTGRGEISNILLEFMGLDGGEVIKFFLSGDRNVQMRCAAAAFDVKNGLMTSRTIVLDTTDTVINGAGKVNLANETLDIRLEPAPKDKSILSFRSPLLIGGTFASPSAGPEKTALAGRAALAIALGVINPFLALAATVETGPGVDQDCGAVLSRAQQPSPAGKPASAKK